MEGGQPHPPATVPVGITLYLAPEQERVFLRFIFMLSYISLTPRPVWYGMQVVANGKILRHAGFEFGPVFPVCQ